MMTGPDTTSPAAANGKTPPSPCPYLDPENAPLPKSGWLRRWPAVTFVLPFAIFMIVGSLEPSPPNAEIEAKYKSLIAVLEDPNANAAEKKLAEEDLIKVNEERHHAMPYEYYPYVYSIKIGLTFLAMLLVLPGYLAFPFRVHEIAIVVGIVGAIVWIGLFQLHLEKRLLEPLGLGSVLSFVRRPGFNPLEQLKDNPQWAYGFLAIRFFGLVVVISIVEEFFLRGFLMRYVMDIDWHLIPFAVVNRLALITGTVFPMLMHPGELFAAAIWFSMVTWLMLRTKSIWDCIIAHAVTNLLMGIWVVTQNDWEMM
jgi:CAAX prenyl protease-like protein